jgi:NDP-mannose synthase
MYNKAIILAGGKGTRLKPYTTVIPKPLVPIGERAIIQILIERLKKKGFTDLTLCVNHMSDLIMAYLGNGKKYGVKVEYSLEDKPLSTVAPIKLIKQLPQHFLVMNGDLLTDLDFRELFKYHMQKKSLLTVATYERKVKIDFGVIGINKENNQATSFTEKPEYDYSVSMGVYVFNRDLLEIVPKNKPFGFDHLMLALLEKKIPINLFPYKGYWLDIGRPDDYEKANEDITKILNF